MGLLDLFRRIGWRREERDLREDIAFHLEMSASAYRAAGHTPEEAERLARVKFGGVDRVEEAARDAAGGRVIADLLSDVRHAARMLVRSPAFSLVAIVSLALGIGASAAMFGVADAVLLQPLPYPDAERIVQVGVLDRGDEQPSVLSELDVQEIVAGSRSFAAAGPAYPEYAGFAVVADGGAEQVRGSWISPGAFDALGVQPMLGSGLRPEHGVPGAPPVVLLSERYWRDRHGGSPDIVGSSLRIHGELRTVVGVMPAGFGVPGFRDDDLWLVTRFEGATVRAPFFLRLIARLQPGRTIEEAEQELGPIATAVAASYPGSTTGWRYVVTPMHEIVVRDSRATIWMLTGAVTLVMLIAIVNVATLLVVRTATREPELAVRVALGAGRGRIARQLLAESLVLTFAGAAGAGIVAFVLLGILRRGAADILPRMHEVDMTGRLVAAMLVLALIAAILISSAALLRISRGPGFGLRQGVRAAAERRGLHRVRHVLVVVEFALALTVLVGAGLLVASLRRLEAVDPGVNTQRLLSVRLSLPNSDYPEEPQRLAFYEGLAERIEALPAVQSVSVSMAVPPSRLMMTNPVRRADRPVPPGVDLPNAEQLLVTPGYFDTFGIPLARGRGFTPQHRDGTPLVAIVNEEFVRRFYPDGDALGGRIQLGSGGPDSPPYEIIGIAADVKYAGLDAPPDITVYVPYAQHAWWPIMYVAIRSAVDPLTLVPQVRREVAAIDPRLPLQEVTTIEGLMRESTRAPRLRSRLLLSFAITATLLAMTGIYGVMAFVMTQRLREMSIRMALGARAGDVARLVINGGLRLAGIGALLGLGVAVAASRTFERFVFGIEPTDVRVLLMATVVLLLAAVAATLAPAIRAARTQPGDALRLG